MYNLFAAIANFHSTYDNPRPKMATSDIINKNDCPQRGGTIKNDSRGILIIERQVGRNIKCGTIISPQTIMMVR